MTNPRGRPLFVHEQPADGVLIVHSGSDDRSVAYVPAERLQEAVDALDKAATWLAVAGVWITEPDRNAKIRRAERDALVVA